MMYRELSGAVAQWRTKARAHAIAMVTRFLHRDKARAFQQLAARRGGSGACVQAARKGAFPPYYPPRSWRRVFVSGLAETAFARWHAVALWGRHVVRFRGGGLISIDIYGYL
jgi:hypothetical protein